MTLNVQLLQSSFLKVIPGRETFARVFYNTLFSAYPETRVLFTGTDMRMQQSKLFAVLSMTINNLNNPALVKSTLSELGKHHISFNVKPEHYAMVGEALLKTLAIVLGDAWTPELERAWAEGYQAIANLMCEDYQLTTRVSH